MDILTELNDQKQRNMDKYIHSMRGHSQPMIDWAVDLYRKHGIHITRQIKNEVFDLPYASLAYTKEEYLFFADYGCDILIKKLPYLEKDKLHLFILERFIVLKKYQQRWYDFTLISKYVDDWIDDTYDEYEVDLRSFASDWVSKFDRDGRGDYDFKRENPFKINNMYNDIKDKVFINNKKKELEILLVYVWTNSITDNQQGWDEYISNISV